MSRQTALRFDHKEIAVIFSLFIFVAMLMFTVGILVGKGLTVAKFEAEGVSTLLPERAPAGLATAPATGPATEALLEPSRGSALSTESVEPMRSTPDYVENTPPRTAEPLKLVPKKPAVRSALGDSLLEKNSKYSNPHVLKDPKVADLLESGSSSPKRKPNALPTVPVSFGAGAYTVQIASYPNKQDAEFRVQALKKLGFPHAYLSAKQLGEKKTTWFRVWLGFFPNFDTAKENAEFLQKKGEVKNYFVRKAEKNNS